MITKAIDGGYNRVSQSHTMVRFYGAMDRYGVPGPVATACIRPKFLGRLDARGQEPGNESREGGDQEEIADMHRPGAKLLKVHAEEGCGEAQGDEDDTDDCDSAPLVSRARGRVQYLAYLRTASAWSMHFRASRMAWWRTLFPSRLCTMTVLSFARAIRAS